MTDTLVTTPGSVSLPTRQAVQDYSRSRQEPDWLLQIRLRAFDAFQQLPTPDQRTEGWRRTPLRGLNLETSDPLSGGGGVSVTGDAHAVVVPLAEAVRDSRLGPRVRDQFAQVVPTDVDRFVAFHYAFFNTGVVVLVPRGKAIDSPVWVEYTASGSLLAHSLVILEDESQLMGLVEDYRGGAGLASSVVEQVVGANAHLRYVHLQRLGFDAWNFSTQRAHLGPDASLRTLNVAAGSRLARNAVQVVLDGRGSQADLLGVVDIDGRQHVDFQTLQDHYGDATRSDLVIHDALRGRSSANFTGLIRINKSAHQTESSQEQKNILLSDSAKADSDPKLEILNNDVIRCTHGAAVGPVDEEMVFYLQSRGLERSEAEELIVEGFFQSTLAKLGVPSVEAPVWSAITDGWSQR